MSIIEFIQFKKKLFNALKADENYKDSVEDVTNKYLCLPESCPKSAIVSGNYDYKVMARLLYLKYIKIGSEWEINIAYDNRMKYMSLMDNEREWLNNDKQYNDWIKLYGLFDLCIMDMISLIQSAFSRFKTKDIFLLLQQQEITEDKCVLNMMITTSNSLVL